MTHVPHDRRFCLTSGRSRLSMWKAKRSSVALQALLNTEDWRTSDANANDLIDDGSRIRHFPRWRQAS